MCCEGGGGDWEVGSRAVAPICLAQEVAAIVTALCVCVCWD